MRQQAAAKEEQLKAGCGPSHKPELAAAQPSPVIQRFCQHLREHMEQRSSGGGRHRDRDTALAGGAVCSSRAPSPSCLLSPISLCAVVTAPEPPCFLGADISKPAQ